MTWRTSRACSGVRSRKPTSSVRRSEEHTSELQSRSDLVCRLLLEKKKKTDRTPSNTQWSRTEQVNNRTSTCNSNPHTSLNEIEAGTLTRYTQIMHAIV